MKNIKSFDSYHMNEGESGYYPAGTEFDPSAPWNQDDPSTTRGYEPKKEKIKFEVVGSDYQELALLKDKRNGKLYLMYFDPGDDDFREFMEVPYEVVGQDEDGFAEYEYNWDAAEIDDDAIIGYASIEAEDPQRLGAGLEAFEDGKIAEVDAELAADMIKTMTPYLEKEKARASHWNQWKVKSMEKMMDTLGGFVKESVGVYEGEGIHPAIRQHLMDFLKENPKATYAEARNHISDKIKGWELSEEDFEEAKSL